MNIWILNHYAGLPAAPSGTRHFDFACRIVERGHAVTLIVSAVDYHKRTSRGLAANQPFEERDESGVRLIRLRGRAYGRNDGIGRFLGMVEYAARAYKECRKQTPPPDIIVGSTVHHFAGLAAWGLARRFGVPFVFEVRDIWPESIMEIGKMSKWHPAVILFGALDRFLLSRADTIITLLPLAINRLVAGGAKRDSVFVVPNGVDLKRIPSHDDTTTRKPGPFRVMFAGSYVRANNIGLLLRAARLVQERKGADGVSFIFVGTGPEESALKAEADMLGLKNVEFRKAVPKKKIIDTLRQADTLILNLHRSPLYEFGISLNKLFDYLAAGRPVIFGFQDPVHNPVAESGAGCTVEPENSEALAEAVLSFSRLPRTELARMGLAGLEYVGRRHNIDDLADMYLQILSRTRAGSRQAPDTVLVPQPG